MQGIVIGQNRVERTLLSASFLNLLCSSHPDQSVMWLELLHSLVRVVDQGEPGALASTIVCSKSEDADLVFVCFVELSELFSEFVFGAVRSAGVENVSVRSCVSAAYSSGFDDQEGL